MSFEKSIQKRGNAYWIPHFHYKFK